MEMNEQERKGRRSDGFMRTDVITRVGGGKEEREEARSTTTPRRLSRDSHVRALTTILRQEFKYLPSYT